MKISVITPFVASIAVIFLYSPTFGQMAVPTRRLDATVIEATLQANTTAGAINDTVSDADSYENMVNRTVSEGAVHAQSRRYSGKGIAEGLNATIAIPPPLANVTLASVDTSSLHTIHARAKRLGDLGDASIMSEQSHGTQHLVLSPRQLTPDGWYTLHGHMHLLANGSDTENIEDCVLSASVGNSEMEAEYIGDGEFSISGTLERDTESPNAGFQLPPLSISQVVAGGVNLHFYSQELVGPGPGMPNFEIESSEATSTSVAKGGPLIADVPVNGLGEATDIWSYGAHAAGFVTDER